MITRHYQCSACGYEHEHEPYTELCPACLKPFLPLDTDNESEAAYCSWFVPLLFSQSGTFLFPIFVVLFLLFLLFLLK